MYTQKEEIVKALKESQQHHLSLYLKLHHQSGEILTVVKDMLSKDVILVEPVTVPGVEFPRSSFYLDEIESVAFARIFFNASLYAKIRDMKGNLRSFHERLTSRKESEQFA